MKKLLFGIMALSALSFGANPGDNSPTTAGKGSASVPMDVLVTVLPPSSKLVLVNESGTVLNSLKFDHQTTAIGGSEKRMSQTVVLRRADGKAFADGAATGTFTAKFEAKNEGGAVITDGKLVLNNLIGAGAVTTIDSVLEFNKNVITLDAAATEAKTTVFSTIPAIAANAATGLYQGAGTFTATLELN